MIGRWVWIGWLVIFVFGCGEVALRPFVPASDAGADVDDDGGRDDDDDDDDDDDAGIDDDDDDAGIGAISP